MRMRHSPLTTDYRLQLKNLAFLFQIRSCSATPAGLKLAASHLNLQGVNKCIPPHPAKKSILNKMTVLIHPEILTSSSNNRMVSWLGEFSEQHLPCQAHLRSQIRSPAPKKPTATQFPTVDIHHVCLSASYITMNTHVSCSLSFPLGSDTVLHPYTPAFTGRGNRGGARGHPPPQHFTPAWAT